MSPHKQGQNQSGGTLSKIQFSVFSALHYFNGPTRLLRHINRIVHKYFFDILEK
jgi:hypothetical protein